MENGIVKPMLRSLLISYVLSGILLAALAFALYKLRLKEGQVNLMVYAVCLLTCLCGGFWRASASGSAGSSGGFCQGFCTSWCFLQCPGP